MGVEVNAPMPFIYIAADHKPRWAVCLRHGVYPLMFAFGYNAVNAWMQSRDSAAHLLILLGVPFAAYGLLHGDDLMIDLKR